jgi:hypothetical protein
MNPVTTEDEIDLSTLTPIIDSLTARLVPDVSNWLTANKAAIKTALLAGHPIEEAVFDLVVWPALMHAEPALVAGSVLALRSHVGAITGNQVLDFVALSLP